jgi:CheY-like chemotaxis protein
VNRPRRGARRRPTTTSATSDEKSNILIVDDLPEKLLVFGTVLEELGQNLVFVSSGSEALREVLHREFAVILLDVNMPDIDGFETAALIRKYKRSAHTPIIFITAYADEIQTGQGLLAGRGRLHPVAGGARHPAQQGEGLRRPAPDAAASAPTGRRARRAGGWPRRRDAVAEENDRRSNFLSQASRVLSGSLDVSVGARLLLELVVPQGPRRWPCCS